MHNSVIFDEKKSMKNIPLNLVAHKPMQNITEVGHYSVLETCLLLSKDGSRVITSNKKNSCYITFKKIWL